MTARVPMVSLERARELGEAMGMPARRTQSEAFRTVANNPGVARVAFSQLMQLLENNRFDTRLRELMIMRIGWVTGSAYEWTQHWRVATTAGIPPEDILAVRDWRSSDRLNEADRAILAATDECLAGKSISDAVWAEVSKHVADPAEQVEFIIAMGNWMMFSLLFRNLRIPLAEGIAVWPPDGLALAGGGGIAARPSRFPPELSGRLLRRCAPRNDSEYGRHCERCEAIPGRDCDFAGARSIGSAPRGRCRRLA